MLFDPQRSKSAGMPEYPARLHRSRPFAKGEGSAAALLWTGGPPFRPQGCSSSLRIKRQSGELVHDLINQHGIGPAVDKLEPDIEPTFASRRVQFPDHCALSFLGNADTPARKSLLPYT